MNINSLYIVATPIGNLKDITLRAIETLKNVDFIAAEDTRHSLFLLQHYEIHKPLISLHAYNEQEQTEKILNKIKNGYSVAYISDAGTPLVSDPGFYLVKQTLEQGYKVIPIPGPCAAIAALSASGLPTDKFVFEGFLPAKNTARMAHLKTLMNETRTIIFYEAPHRLLECLTALKIVFGETRKIVIARELTKLFETIRVGSVNDVLTQVTQDPKQQLGEFVILVEGNLSPATQEEVTQDQLLRPLLNELPLAQAVKIASKISGLHRSKLYARALSLTKSKD